MSAITPAAVLRMAEGIEETAENFPILRELKAALKDLVTITIPKEDQP